MCDVLSMQALHQVWGTRSEEPGLMNQVWWTRSDEPGLVNQVWWRACALETSHTMRKVSKYICDTFGSFVVANFTFKICFYLFLVEYPFEIDVRAVACFFVIYLKMQSVF